MVVVDDLMQAHELETERVDALYDAVERGLIHEVAVKKRHPVLGSELELRECGSQHRSRLATDLELESLTHDDHLSGLARLTTSVVSSGCGTRWRPPSLSSVIVWVLRSVAQPLPARYDPSG